MNILSRALGRPKTPPPSGKKPKASALSEKASRSDTGLRQIAKMQPAMIESIPLRI